MDSSWGISPEGGPDQDAAMGSSPTRPAGVHPAAILAAVEDMTGLVVDVKDDDTSVKAEPLSPVSNASRQSLSLLTRPRPLKFKSAVTSPRSPVQVPPKLPGEQSGRPKAGNRSKASRDPLPLPQPIVPKKMEQWEPWKAVLHDLYITQNRILRDIIEIMELKYNVRGT